MSSILINSYFILLGVQARKFAVLLGASFSPTLHVQSDSQSCCLNPQNLQNPTTAHPLHCHHTGPSHCHLSPRLLYQLPNWFPCLAWFSDHLFSTKQPEQSFKEKSQVMTHFCSKSSDDPLPCKVKKKSSYKDLKGLCCSAPSYSLAPHSLLQPLWPPCLNIPNTLPLQGLCTGYSLFLGSLPQLSAWLAPVSIMPLQTCHLSEAYPICLI